MNQRSLRSLLAFACALAACGSEPAAAPGGETGDTDSGAGDASRPDAARAVDARLPVDAPRGTGGSGAGGSGGLAEADGGRRGDRDGALDGASDAAAPDAALTLWPAVDNYGAHGPFATTREMNTGPAGAYDVFRPTTLGAQGRKHPIISWANGTLFGLEDYRDLLDHWASHGFVVIAAHTNSTAGGGTHKAGIDWLRAEQARAGSGYFGVLDGKRVGAAGHSQGGGATIAAGSNKPGVTGIVATLPLMPILSYESDKSIVARQAAAMLNINATMDDRDPSGLVAKQIFDGAAAELVQAAFIGVHEDAMSAAMRRPTLAWFRFRLMDDDSARTLFYPSATCGLCQDPAWKQVRYKNAP
jgi:hypothetical protein